MMNENKSFKPVTLVYHVTRLENVEAIEREGLQADADGNIYAFTDLLVADCIASTQVFANPYALFCIRPSGIEGPLFADNVAELSSPLHCVIQQDCIAPEYLWYLGTMSVQQDNLTPWQWMSKARMGLSRSQIEAAYCNACQVNGGLR